MHTAIMHIPIDDIDTDFRKFKISRNFIPENLSISIKKYGIINPVYLINIGRSYNVVFGFNRIACAKESGFKTIPAFIDNTVYENYFTSQSVVKFYNNEIGPSGKVKLIKIFYDEFKFSEEKIQNSCLDFSMPVYFSKSENFEKFLSLPVKLLDYLDSRDVQFKIIDKILKLEIGITEILSDWTDSTGMKLNIFKSIADMLFDLQKGGVDIDSLKKILPENYEDRNVAESIIHDSILKLRYPEYFEMMKKSDKIRNSMAGKKVIAEIPKYFDSGQFFIKIPVDRKSGYAGLKKRFDSIKSEDVEEILELL